MNGFLMVVKNLISFLIKILLENYMKIGIITILKVNNYGAELQAYALQRVLNLLGYDAEIIDYLFYKNPQHKKTVRSRPNFHFGIKKILVERLYPIYTKIRMFLNSKNENVREQRFALFHKKNTRLSKTYKTIDELFEAKMDYDIYMVGSDQVWNPGIYSSLDPYFLKFAPQNRKKIAYASSFGVSEIPSYACSYYREALKDFDAIGVRENNAVELVRHLSGKSAQWVLDPTLLLTKDNWNEIAVLPEEVKGVCDGYILLYELTPCPYILQLAHYFSKSLNLPIVRICKNASVEDRDRSIINITDAGPNEFIGLFAHAKLVITNSFHGTAFSINLERDFYTVTPLRKQNNSRQQSLLKLFQLESRLLVEGVKFPPVEHRHIDYIPVMQRLSEERKKSIRFLTDNCK